MSRAAHVWLLIFIAGLLYEAWTLLNHEPGDTLTETLWALITRFSPWGGWIFGLGWVTFSVWFTGHILRWWR